MKKDGMSSQPGEPPVIIPLANYIETIGVINQYAVSIEKQQFPTLNNPPADYANFPSQFAPVQQHGVNWSANIFPAITQYPSIIVSQASPTFNVEENLVAQYLMQLLADPVNTVAQQALANSLNTLQQLVQQQQADINNLQGQLSGFLGVLPGDVSILLRIADEALADAQDDPQNASPLRKLAQQLDLLANENTGVQALFPAVTTIWNALNTQIDKVAAALTETVLSANASQYPQALNCFQVVANDWNELMILASALANIHFQQPSNNAVIA